MSALATWYRNNGRHDIPWRQTRDPWAILVSEVMLQQTPVARVRAPWETFMHRWPTPSALASAHLNDVLRAWKGLGYPRRARALWDCANLITTNGWPQDETGLRELPGVGSYTARALLCFAFNVPALPPRDVNLARVAARAWLGRETHEVTATALDVELAKRRPRDLNAKDFAYALFDVGAGHCGARRVDCWECPLHRTCASRQRLAGGVPARPRKQAPYEGSMRQLRGAVLAALLGPESIAEDDLAIALGGVPLAAQPKRICEAVASLRADGLLPVVGGSEASC